MPELQAGVLRRGTNVELPSFDPQYVIGNSAGAIMYDLFEGLVTRAPDGSIMPAIAESWTVSEDGRVYTFQLNENAKWSDGRQITAGDFVWSYKRILDPLSGTRGASALFPVLNAWAISLGEKPVDELGVKAISPTTLEIVLDGPAPYFIQLLASYSNAPVPRHAIEKHGRRWTQPGNMVTNGAYVLNKVVTNTYYQLVKNPHYHGADKVTIEEVFYYPVPSPTTSLEAIPGRGTGRDPQHSLQPVREPAQDPAGRIQHRPWNRTGLFGRSTTPCPLLTTFECARPFPWPSIARL